MVSIENIFAAGAAVLAGRQLGEKNSEGASRTVSTVIGLLVILGIALCVGGIYFSQPAADVLTIIVCVCSVRAMKRIASECMRRAS